MSESYQHLTPEPELKLKKPTYHYAVPFQAVKYGIVHPEPILLHTNVNDSDEVDIHTSYESWYQWLKNQTGFYPLFLAVGRTAHDKKLTFYQTNWEGDDNPDKNKVMFSFDNLGGIRPVYMDDGIWCTLLSFYKPDNVPNALERSLFKKSYIKNDWITYANKNPGSVIGIVPQLDLRMASGILVKDDLTLKSMKKMGFDNLKVSRID